MICPKCKSEIYYDKQYKCPYCNALKIIMETDYTRFKNLTIDEIFTDKDFEAFRVYCHNKEHVFVCDIKKLNFDNFCDVDGIESTILLKVVDKLTEKKASYGKSELTLSLQRETYPFSVVREEYLDLSIGEALGLFGITKKNVAILQNRGYESVSDLIKLGDKDIVTLFTPKVARLLIRAAEYMKYSVGDLLESVFSEEQHKSNVEIFKARLDGCTYQEIAGYLSVSKEMVRQKINKFQNKLEPYTELAVNRLFIDGVLYIKSIEEAYTEESMHKVIIESCILNKSLEYLDFANLFIRTDGSKSVEEELRVILQRVVGTGIHLYDDMDKIRDALDEAGYCFIDIDSAINLLQKHSFYKYKNYLSQNQSTYSLLAEKIIAKHFPKGIKLCSQKGKSEDMDTLRNLLFEEYGDLGLPTNDRSLSSRIYEHLVLSGRGEAIAKENIRIPITLLEEIKSYIDQLKYRRVYYTEIFSHFSGELERLSNVDNHNFLHGVLMMYYPDNYEYSRDFLTKAEITGASTDLLIDRIRMIIKNSGGPVRIEEIKEHLKGYSESLLTSTIAASRDVFQWEYNYYNCSDNLSLTEEYRIKAERVLSDILINKDGYCSENMAFEILNTELPDFFVANTIKKPSNLYYILEYWFSELYDFRRPHIAERGKYQQLITKEIALDQMGYPEMIVHEDFLCLADKNRWTDATTTCVFREIETDYIRISQNEYLHCDKLILENGVSECLSHVLTRHLCDGILPASMFTAWEELPDIGIPWNKFLLESILNKINTEIKVIYPAATDRRISKGILVDAGSELNNYQDVIVRLMKNAGYTRMLPGKFLKFLVNKGVANVVIPKELYTGEKIKFHKDAFIVVD